MTRLFALAVLAFAGCTVSFIDEAPEPRPDATIDGPDASSAAPLCGNAIVDVASGEQCDDGNVVNGDGCSSDCRLAVCGNAVVDVASGEQCDDGNVVNGDGCSTSCQVE